MKSTRTPNEAYARIELENIQLELTNRRAQHLRHFVDQYYCYKHGHIKIRTGAADWESIVWNGSVSLDAARSRGNRKLVVKEHVVPLRVIREMLIELSRAGKATLEGIATVLDENVRFATISRDEDKVCSGQQNPDSDLDRFSAFAGGTPSLKVCGLTQL